jgi:hypothetical protein
VQKVRCDHVRREWSVCLLKDDCDNVISNVTLPLQLLLLSLGERQQSGDVKHDLLPVEAFVQRLFASLAILSVQTTPKN